MNNNTMYDVDFTRALPATLKGDETINALGRVIAAELQETIRLSRLNIIYPRIDELEEHLLDILAYDLHIDWYDPDSPPDVKRAIIKNSVRVHKRIGTKYAVESVVTAYFGSGEVQEWYEYGGKPHHFKIISGNPSITDEQAAKFFRILEVVKRKSSWLESILITLTGKSPLFVGVIHKDFTRETHIIGARDGLNLFFKTVYHEQTYEKTAFGSGQINAFYSALIHEQSTDLHSFEGE